LEEEGVKHILLYCMGAKKWKEKYLCNKWFSTNDDLDIKRIINYTKAADLKKISEYTCIKLDVNERVKSARYN
jgi:hypothetical protein